MVLLVVAVSLFALFGGWAPYAEVEPVVVAPVVGVAAAEFFGSF
jgi:hypothetical protein